LVADFFDINTLHVFSMVYLRFSGPLRDLKTTCSLPLNPLKIARKLGNSMHLTEGRTNRQNFDRQCCI